MTSKSTLKRHAVQRGEEMINDQTIQDSEGIKALKELMRCFNWHNGYDDDDKKKFFTIVHDALVSANAITSMQTEQPAFKRQVNPTCGWIIDDQLIFDVADKARGLGCKYDVDMEQAEQVMLALETMPECLPAPVTSMQCDSEPVA